MMGAVTNLLVLLCAVSYTQAWENLPNIPANRRAEYYLLHDDGAYKYGYDTGSGSSHVAMADPSNEVRGSYAYQSPEGPVQLIYTAGRGGFVPDFGSQSVRTSFAGSSAGVAGVKSSHNTVHTPSIATASRPVVQEKDADYDENADASYNFNFDTDEYKRQEASDAKGNIRGRYTYNSKEGNRVAVTYKAGAGTGFVIENQEGLDAASQYSVAKNVPQYSSVVPKTASVPAPKPYSGPLANTVASGPLADGSYSFSYQSDDHERQESGDSRGFVRGKYSYVANDGVRRTIDYQAGADLGYVPSGDGVAPPVAPVAPQIQAYTARPAIVAPQVAGYQYPQAPQYQTSSAQEEETSGDASYAFAYEADDHARKETSDPSGNVAGEYSYTSPDGQNRKIKYSAGAEKGFVVESSQETAAAKTSYVAPTSAHSAPAAPKTSYVVPTSAHSAHANIEQQPRLPSSFAAHHTAVTKQVTDSVGSVGNTDASYAFSYQTNDHSHRANADPSGHVRGSYSFVADDGISRQVEYEAGSRTGFIAKGAHLPVAPEVAVPAVAVKSSPVYTTPVAAKSPAPVAYVAPTTKASTVGHSVASAPVDGSYSFAYDTADSSRQESSDTSGYVRGRYSFTADDGVSRSVQYEAGANKGFIAQGSHLPVAVTPEAVTISRASIAQAPTPAVVKPQAVSSYSSTSHAAEEKGDASYAYNYQTDSSSKSESSDAVGNVVGTFTYVGGDGHSRTLNYVAGPESGFQASGAHLPVAPVASLAHATAPITPAVVASKTSSNVASTGSWTKAASWSAPAANFVLHKFLPPESAHKFGYVFDTQA